MSNDKSKGRRNYSWVSIALGFSILPIILISRPLWSLLPHTDAASFYYGLGLAVFTLVLEAIGLALGLFGIVKGPNRIMSAVGTAVCLFFGFTAVMNIFR